MRTRKSIIATTNSIMSQNQFNALRREISNTATTLRREVIERMLNPQNNIDGSCGYPESLGIHEYKEMYDRMGMAQRVVKVWPEESWAGAPEIYEQNEKEKTPFEEALEKLEREKSIYSYLYRADILSGIGRYGILLLGIDDGKVLSEPVAGINPSTGEVTKRTKDYKLLYLRAFDESALEIKSIETDVKSPRYGQPKEYTIKFSSEDTKGSVSNSDQVVHWTRVIHIADNREVSETYGIPRLHPVYNNLYDIKKISGGSGEMFWKGGFPGYSFELTPDAQAAGAEIDAESIKEQMTLWANGLQRWLALTGVTAKSLMPQVADPTGHVDVHVKLIAMSLGIPYRVLLGSEEAKLASSQDKKTWNERVSRRQDNYLTPHIIKPFIDRMIAFGVLPTPERYYIEWSNLNAPTLEEIAKIALTQTQAMGEYVTKGVSSLIEPADYLTLIHKMSPDEVDVIEQNAEDYEGKLNVVDELETELEDLHKSKAAQVDPKGKQTKKEVKNEEV